MRNLDNIIKRLDFKKIAKVYLLFSLIILILCILTGIYVTRDKIYMALEYQKSSEIFRKQGVGDTLDNELKKMASSSKDIIDIIVTDKNNNIIFKTNDSIIKGEGKFLFLHYEQSSDYLQDNINKDIIYKVVPEDNIILNVDYIQNNRQILTDIDNRYSYERDLGNKTIYLLNYMVKSNTKSKVYIVRIAQPIPYAETLLEAIGAILGIIFAIYWIGLALWVYKDASEKKNNPPLWGLMVLLTNVIGLIIYSIYKQNNTECYNCGAIQSKDDIFCSHCGSRLNEQCPHCKHIVDDEDEFCKSCGKKI